MDSVAEHWLPALDGFKPQFILVSAGFDAHVLDDMSGFNLAEMDYEWLGQEILKVAQKYADGRILAMLEGGYEPGALARSVVAFLKALLG